MSTEASGKNDSLSNARRSVLECGKRDCNAKTQPAKVLVWDKAKVDREIDNKRSRTWGIVEIVDSSDIESHPAKENYIKIKALRKQNRADIYLYYTYRDLPPVKEHICALDFSYDLEWYHSLQLRLGKFDTIYVRNPSHFGDDIKISGCFDDDEEQQPETQEAGNPASSTDRCEPAV